jgi:predicted solute-binding protein
MTSHLPPMLACQQILGINIPKVYAVSSKRKEKKRKEKKRKRKRKRKRKKKKTPLYRRTLLSRA